MKIKNKKHNTIKFIAILAGAVLLIAVVGALYSYVNTISPVNDTTSQPAETDSSTTESIKQEEDKAPKASNAGTSEESGTETKKAEVGVIITRAEKDSKYLNIGTLIEKPVSSGTCTLTLTKGSSIISVTSGVQISASVSTCKGFRLSLSELQTGTWTINISFENDSLAGSATTTRSI